MNSIPARFLVNFNAHLHVLVVNVDLILEGTSDWAICLRASRAISLEELTGFAYTSRRGRAVSIDRAEVLTNLFISIVVSVSDFDRTLIVLLRKSLHKIVSVGMS